MASKYQSLKDQVYEANMQLPELGLVLYTFGNVSGVDHDLGVMAIKPSGVAYSELKPEQIVVLDLDNTVIEGDLRASSDTKTHNALYRAYPDIGGIVHTHSTYAVAWAQACQPIPCFGTTHADHLAAEIPCTGIMRDDQIQGDYEEETGVQIIEALAGQSAAETEMILVAGHGPFTWGKSPEKAVYNSAVLEELARMAYLTLQINPQQSPLKKTLIEKHFQRKHGKHAYYGQSC